MRSLSTITIAYMNISAVTGFRLCISRLIAGRTFAASDAGVVVLVAAVVAACLSFVRAIATHGVVPAVAGYSCCHW